MKEGEFSCKAQHKTSIKMASEIAVPQPYPPINLSPLTTVAASALPEAAVVLPCHSLSPNFSSVITLLLQFELRAESGESETL